MIQKKIWKACLIIGISLFLTSLNSCGGSIDEIKTVSYIYKNNTGFDLSLEVYDNEDVMFKSFTILNGESVETNTTAEEGPAIFWFHEPILTTGNSVIIRFSDNKCLKYYRRDISNGMNGDKIFDAREYDNYSNSLIQQSVYTLYYTFTPVDYNTSTDCI